MVMRAKLYIFFNKKPYPTIFSKKILPFYREYIILQADYYFLFWLNEYFFIIKVRIIYV